MAVNNMINRLRTRANLSQEQFAEIFGVSRQSVQKWESGNSLPELDKLIKIAKHFDVTVDSLIFDSDTRITEELKGTKELKPKYENLHTWEAYYTNLETEYTQSIEEGLDISQYEELFKTVAMLPRNDTKKKLADILFEVVRDAKIADGYKYNEPSTLDEIQQLRDDNLRLPMLDKTTLKEKIHGAWMGRICGCLLGKTIEGIRTDQLIPVLKKSNNYPMHRYIERGDIDFKMVENYRFRFEKRPFADEMDGMPVDDDTNYVVLAQKLIEKYGKDFTDYDMSRIWLSLQPKDAYCTAERVAFCNFVKGYEPPQSAIYKNPYREWIGAQIRGDYFGYISPGNPEFAAEMAFRDASISHVKNGIYGEMFIAAMIAAAAVTNDIKQIILSGLAQIPNTSRLYEAITDVIKGFEDGVSQKDCFDDIHSRYNEFTAHGWCHTISNAMIVAASLLYGGGDYGKSICMAVETGFDTDCNGATVGSILGMANGIDSIDMVWQKPINNKLHTSIFGVDTISVTDAGRENYETHKLVRRNFMKIYNLGSLNIDYVYSVEHIATPKETITSSDMQKFAGGKGLNQSVALARAGAQVIHGGNIGHDGKFLKDVLQGEKVDVSKIKTLDKPTGHAIIQVDYKGQNSILLYSGTNYCIDYDYVLDFLNNANEGDILLLQNEISALKDIFEIANEKKMQIAFNPSPCTPSLKDLPLQYVKWWFCNEVESKELFDSCDEKVIEQNFLSKYPNSNLILTLGEQGSVFINKDVVIKQAAYKTNVVDTTAAGDTFTGYFLSAISQNKTIEYAMDIASKAACVTVSRKGASPSIPYLNKLL